MSDNKLTDDEISWMTGFISEHKEEFIKMNPNELFSTIIDLTENIYADRLMKEIGVYKENKLGIEFPSTNNKINYELDNKEFILQKFHKKFRCISWHPHYIETPWYDTKEDAISEADKTIEEFYDEYNAED